MLDAELISGNYFLKNSTDSDAPGLRLFRTGLKSKIADVQAILLLRPVLNSTDRAASIAVKFGEKNCQEVNLFLC